MGIGQFLTQPQPQKQDLERQVTELQIHREHDRESLTEIKTKLDKIQWWLLIMTLGQVVMFLFQFRVSG